VGVVRFYIIADAPDLPQHGLLASAAVPSLPLTAAQDLSSFVEHCLEAAAELRDASAGAPAPALGPPEGGASAGADWTSDAMRAYACERRSLPEEPGETQVGGCRQANSSSGFPSNSAARSILYLISYAPLVYLSTKECHQCGV
jgi:hypothetical protein